MSEKNLPPQNGNKPATNNKPNATPTANTNSSTPTTNNTTNTSPTEKANNQTTTTPATQANNTTTTNTAPKATTTPPSPNNNKPTTPPTPNKPTPQTAPTKTSGSGLSLLAILIALASAGIGGYSYLQIAPLKTTLAATEAQALSAEKRVVEAEKTVEALKGYIANGTQGLDKAEVSQLITDALQDYAKTQTSQYSNDDLKAYIDEQIAALKPNDNGISEAQVQTLITQSLANFANNGDAPKIDLSKELESIRVAQADAEKALTSLNQRAQQINQALVDKAQVLSGQLQASAQTQTNPQPLITALTLADIAANAGNYKAASDYLGQADASFIAYHLNDSNFAQYQPQVSELRNQFVALAAQPSPVITIDGVMKGIDNWTFKTTHQPTTSPEQTNMVGETWTDTAKNVGNKILHRTFKVVHNDDSGLTWINAHPDLQTLIRENIRLDLTFARNTLQIHDLPSYTSTLENLVPRIEYYFDTNDANVADALKTLNALKAQAATQVPNITALTDAVKKTAEKE